MNKTAMFAMIVLIMSAVCIMPAAENDGAAIENDHVLMYDVYKIDDINTSSKPNGSYNAKNVVYFEKNDDAGKTQFENALRDGKPLPQPNVEFNGEVHTLTAYLFASLRNTELHVSVVSESFRVYPAHEENRIMELGTKVYLLSGQNVKITTSDPIDGKDIRFFSEYDLMYGGKKLKNGVNEFEITQRGIHLIREGGSYTAPYISYTLEYDQVPADTSSSGYVFLAVGAAFIAAMVIFARPQKIKER